MPRDLRGELRADCEPLLDRRRSEVEIVEPVQPRELADRIGVIVHPQIDEDVASTAVAPSLGHDEKGGCLLAPPVSPGSLRGRESCDQPLRERLTVEMLEGLGERVDCRAGQEEVPLGRVPGACTLSGPIRLCRDGADLRLRIRNDGSDGEELRLDANAPLALLVARSQATSEYVTARVCPETPVRAALTRRLRTWWGFRTGP